MAAVDSIWSISFVGLTRPYNTCPWVRASSCRAAIITGVFGRNIILISHFQPERKESIYLSQGCGIPMPDLSDLGHFGGRQVDFTRALVRGQVNLGEIQYLFCV